MPRVRGSLFQLRLLTGQQGRRGTGDAALSASIFYLVLSPRKISYTLVCGDLYVYLRAGG